MLSSLEVWIFLLFIRAFFNSRIGYIIDFVIIISAVLYSIENSFMFPLTIQWLWLPSYVLVSIIIFVVSVLLTTKNYAVYFNNLLNSIKTKHFLFQREAAFFAIIAALHEEIIWRVILQSVLTDHTSPNLAVLLVASAFTIWHKNLLSTDKNKIFEFFIFSLLLGASVAITGDPLFAVIIHFFRNYFILLGCYEKKN